MEYVIEAVGLHKTFAVKRPPLDLIRRPFHREYTKALRGVDLQVRRGEVFGLLGPNGAGKTTLLKILSCLVLPDEGQARVNGVDTIHENQVKPNIGLINSDERSFYWRLTGLQNLRFFARIYDVPSARIDSRINELLERVDMVEAANRSFATYSSGMKQRMAIARALLHDPPILFMDEPTRSLDPAASLQLREFVQTELNGREGKTVILATHNMAEAQALSHRIAILIRGKVRQVGSVDEVRRWGVDENRFRLELGASLDGLSGPFRIHAAEEHDGLRVYTISLAPETELDDLLRWLLDARIPIRACDRLQPDLEGAFSRILASQSSQDSKAST